MVENLGRHAVLLGDKLLRNFSDGVDRKGEPVVLLGVGMETHLKKVIVPEFIHLDFLPGRVEIRKESCRTES